MHLKQTLQQLPATGTLHAIPSGPAGIKVTLNLMRRLVREYKTALPIRQTAVALTNGVPQKDWIGEARRVFSFVKDHIRYVKDVSGVETIQTPLRTLQNEAGDCDDKATLLAALLESIGHPTRFVAMAFRPGNYSHVLPEVRIGRRWVPLETTENRRFGWYPQKPHHRMVVSNK